MHPNLEETVIQSQGKQELEGLSSNQGEFPRPSDVLESRQWVALKEVMYFSFSRFFALHFSSVC